MIYTHVLNRPGITVKSPLDDTPPEEALRDGRWVGESRHGYWDMCKSVRNIGICVNSYI
jgi:hypothetical protein